MTPILESRQATANAENTAQAQGNANYGRFANQFNTATAQNNANYGRMNSAYGNLQNYNSTLPSYRTMYGNYFKNGEAATGFNPTAYGQSVQNLTNAQNIQAGLPQAATSAGNYSGATSGQITQDYQNMANSINPYVTNATNAMHNWQAALTGAQNYASGASNVAQTGEKIKSTNLNNLLTGANSAYNTGVTNLNNSGTLLQNAPVATAKALNEIQSGRSGYISAAARRTQAAGTYAQDVSQAALNNQQRANIANLQSHLQQIYGGNYGIAMQYIQKGQKVPAWVTAGNKKTSTTNASQSQNPAKYILQRQYGGYGLNANNSPVGSSSNPYPWVNLGAL